MLWEALCITNEDSEVETNALRLSGNVRVRRYSRLLSESRRLPGKMAFRQKVTPGKTYDDFDYVFHCHEYQGNTIAGSADSQ